MAGLVQNVEKRSPGALPPAAEPSPRGVQPEPPKSINRLIEKKVPEKSPKENQNRAQIIKKIDNATQKKTSRNHVRQKGDTKIAPLRTSKLEASLQRGHKTN